MTTTDVSTTRAEVNRAKIGIVMVTLFLARSGEGQFLLLMNVRGNHHSDDQIVRPKVTLVFKLPTAVWEYFFLISSLSFPTGKSPA